MPCGCLLSLELGICYQTPGICQEYQPVLFVEKPRLTLNTPKGYYCGMEQETKKRALRRLKIIKGQINGLEKMINGEKYCVDIITQSSAIKHALSGIDDLLLEHHLSTHVASQMKSGEAKKATADILKVYKLKK